LGQASDADIVEGRTYEEEGTVDANQPWTDTPTCVLIIEDKGEIRRLYTSELEDEGHRVIDAWDEKSAMDFRHAFSPLVRSGSIRITCLHHERKPRTKIRTDFTSMMAVHHTDFVCVDGQ